MAEAMLKLNSMMFLADIFVPVSFLAVFIVIQIIADAFKPPYSTYEDGLFTVYIYLPSRNRSTYHEYHFVRPESGGLKYVPDRSKLLQTLIPLGFIVALYIYFALTQHMGPGLFLHFTVFFAAFYLICTFFHPVWAWIFLKRQRN